MNEPYEDYSDELKFQVGQRVKIDLPDIPVEQRDVTTGIIVKIDTHFPTSPLHRKHFFTIRLDGKGNYVKEKFRIAGGIRFSFTCLQDRLKLIH